MNWNEKPTPPAANTDTTTSMTLPLFQRCATSYPCIRILDGRLSIAWILDTLIITYQQRCGLSISVLPRKYWDLMIKTWTRGRVLQLGMLLVSWTRF